MNLGSLIFRVEIAFVYVEIAIQKIIINVKEKYKVKIILFYQYYKYQRQFHSYMQYLQPNNQDLFFSCADWAHVLLPIVKNVRRCTFIEQIHNIKAAMSCAGSFVIVTS